MKTISTITRGSRGARLIKNGERYIILATLNHGETFSGVFSGRSWKTEKGAIQAIKKWLF